MISVSCYKFLVKKKKCALVIEHRHFFNSARNTRLDGSFRSSSASSSIAHHLPLFI